jgi:virginiamycin B lyase
MGPGPDVEPATELILRPSARTGAGMTGDSPPDEMLVTMEGEGTVRETLQRNRKRRAVAVGSAATLALDTCAGDDDCGAKGSNIGMEAETSTDEQDDVAACACIATRALLAQAAERRRHRSRSCRKVPQVAMVVHAGGASMRTGLMLSTRALVPAVGVLLTAAACADDDGSDTTAPTTVTASTTTTAPLPEVQDIEQAGALEIHTSGNADWVTVAAGSAWVANIGTGITRYDLATGAMLGELATNDICLAMDEGFGSLWAGDCVDNTLLRIDLATGELAATIDLPFSIPSESSVAVGDNGVWLLSTGTQPNLVRIDPATNEVAESFPAPGGATAVRAGDDSLWITRADAGQLLRVDPATGDVLAEIDAAPGCVFLALGEGGVWTMGSTGEVVHVDPESNSVVATIPTGGRVDHGDVAVGGGYVWARISDSLFAQIDPATNTVVARYGPPSEGSGGIDADDQAVWVSDFLGQTLWRLSLDLPSPMSRRLAASQAARRTRRRGSLSTVSVGRNSRRRRTPRDSRSRLLRGLTSQEQPAGPRKRRPRVRVQASKTLVPWRTGRTCGRAVVNPGHPRTVVTCGAQAVGLSRGMARRVVLTTEATSSHRVAKSGGLRARGCARWSRG